ncbi:MAG: ABC transporter substrate-binding protein [bacterium]
MRRIALLAALSTIVACGGCGGSEDAKKAAANEPLHFWHAMGGPLGKSLEALVADYDATARTKVENVSMGQYEALSQKIMAAVAAGGPPDLAQCYEAWTANLVENHAVVSFDRFLDGPEGAAMRADIPPIFLQASTQGGALWSFPFNKSVRCLYYNRELFKRAGLDPERPPRTWQEYRDDAKKLTVDADHDGKPEQWGFASQITAAMFENLLVQNGGALLTPDETRAAFDSPEGIEALEFMTDMLVRDKTSLVSSGFEYQNEFLAGKVAMVEGSSVTLSFLGGKVTFPLGIAPLPAGKKDTQLVAGTDVVLFATTPERERSAFEFVRWFTDTPQTARWAAETGYLPVRRSAMEHPVLKAQLDAHPGLREAYAQLDRALVQPKAKGWYAGRAILEREAIEPVLRGQLQPAEALRGAAAKVNVELARK